jgi:AAA domain
VAIEVAKRFPIISIWDAYERAQRDPSWIFHETICPSLTLIYGQSSVGKSWLVCSMLLSLLLPDQEFLEMQPSDATKVWKPVILWTDPCSDTEYAKRLCPHLPDGIEVPNIPVGLTIQPGEWEVLIELILSQGYNFVVVDNLEGISGNSKNDEAVAAVFDGLTRLTNKGVPVVLIHHETEKRRPVLGAPPLGASSIVQRSRAQIQVRQTRRKQLRGGNTGLIIKARDLEQWQSVTAEPISPNYKVLKREPWQDGDDEDDKPKDDPNLEIARWVVDSCQGKGVNETAKLVAEKFGGNVGTIDNSLKQRALSKLLHREGSGSTTTWKLDITTGQGQ